MQKKWITWVMEEVDKHIEQHPQEDATPPTGKTQEGGNCISVQRLEADCEAGVGASVA